MMEYFEFHPIALWDKALRTPLHPWQPLRGRCSASRTRVRRVVAPTRSGCQECHGARPTTGFRLK